MTGYHIQIGYNSGCHVDPVDTLKNVVLSICADPQVILDEVLAVEGVAVPSEFAYLYRSPWNDATITFIEDTERFEVYQSASGGGDDRIHKERMRRAVCRLVMRMMHAKGIEVSISVS